MSGPARKPRHFNIQDSFLFQSLRENREMAVALTTGKFFKGRVLRFDRLAVIFSISGQELMVYKHGILSIGDVPGAAARTSTWQGDAAARPPRRRPPTSDRRVGAAAAAGW